VTAELAVLFTFVIAGFVFMGFYLQRGVQGSTKANADSVGSQFSTTSGYASYVASDSHETTDGTVTSTSCSKTDHAIGTASAPSLTDDCATAGDASRTLDNAENYDVGPTLTDISPWR